MSSTTPGTGHVSTATEARVRHRLQRTGSLMWLLPLVSVLTLWGTFRHQPDPSTRFTEWSEFVTTQVFLVQHVVVSILGQTLYILGSLGLVAVLILRSPRGRSAAWGFALAVLGSGGLLAGFGVAAFGQPAVGDLQLQGYEGAQDVYEAMYTPLAFVVILSGAVLWALSTPLLAWSARGIDGVSRTAAWLFGASGPLIAVLGVIVGELQTVGSLAGMLGGVLLARELVRPTLPEDAEREQTGTR
jgi:hypothetical protein